MDMDFVVEQEDVKTNVKLVKKGKPTPWLIGAVALELACDFALGYCAYKLFKALK